MENAFVAIVPTRPCPLFGRPVHRRDGSHRFRPGASPQALRIPPRGGHPALPDSHRGQRGVTPAFGYGALHPSTSGTSTHLSTSLPSAHYATIRLLSSHRHLVVGSSMTTALHAEAERSPRVSTQNFVPTPSPIRPPVRRIWASLPLASSPQVRTPLTALRFRSVRYCIVGLLPDAPSRVVRCCERPCLVDDGFPPSGPQEDLTTTCLTSLFCVHAEHTKPTPLRGAA
jgi:hypothetical protein